MGGDGHIGGFVCQDGLDVFQRNFFAAFKIKVFFAVVVAQRAPVHIVNLQIAAACVVKRADGIFIGLAHVCGKGLFACVHACVPDKGIHQLVGAGDGVFNDAAIADNFGKRLIMLDKGVVFVP